MKPRITVSWILLASLEPVIAQIDPFINFCKLIDHQSVLVDGTLYIDGGRQVFTQKASNGSDVGPHITGLNEYLMTIDMTKSWDSNTNLPIKALQKGTGIPYLTRGAMYPHPAGNKTFLSFGGTVAMDNTTFSGWQAAQDESKSIYSYDVAGNSWQGSDLTSSGLIRPCSGASAYSKDKGLGFYYNGEQDWGSSQQARALNDTIKFIDGMVVLDLHNQSAPARNLSTAAVSASGRVRSQMVHVPLPGSDGILVLLGGGEKPLNDFTHNWKGTLVSFQSIDIFDVGSLANGSSGVWISQSTSGTLPSPRVDACVVVMPAPDNSSHNIYMYGGRDGVNGYYDELWILTMPAFRWVLAYSGNTPRYSMTCHVAGNRQMIVVGGSETSNITATCDPKPQGLGVVDLVSMSWSTKYDANAAAYRVPAQVVKVVGGSQTGGATTKMPANGWTDDRLGAIFNPPTAMSGHAPTLDDPQMRKMSRGGAIAGGVIGALLGLSLIGGLVWFYLRRRNQTRARGLKNPSYVPVNQTIAEFSDTSISDVKKFQDKTGDQLDSTEIYEARGDLPPQTKTAQVKEIGPPRPNTSPVELP